MKPQFVQGALVAASLVFTSISAHASWFITDLGTLGGSYSEAYGINTNGQVVGGSVNQSVFSYSGGQYVFILSPNNLFAVPADISVAPEIDASNSMLGLAILGDLLSLSKRLAMRIAISHWAAPISRTLPSVH